MNMSKCLIAAANISMRSIANNEEAVKSLLYIVVINAVLAVPTIVVNALVIVAILTTSSLQTPSFLLLTSLAFSDLAVGLVGQPTFIFTILSFRNGNAQGYCYGRSVSVALLAVFGCVTTFTVTAISVDRYLAIRLKMRYRTVVTVSRIRRLLLVIWIFSILSISCPYFMSFDSANLFAVTGFLICSFIVVYCYTMSFRALKIHCAQILPQGNQQPNSTTQSNGIDVLKYRKLLMTMILILVFLIVFYSPVIGVLFMFTNPSFNRVVAWSLLTIPILNSLFNPVIYLTRMRDLRQVCFQMLSKILRFH